MEYNTNKSNTQPIIIAVDTGNGNTKTEHTVFKSGVDVYDHEPTLNRDHILLGDKYYIVGEKHMTYQGDKTSSNECYVLTIAGVIKEMEYRHLTNANVNLAVGLPLGWCSKEQKEELRRYMLREASVNARYHGSDYNIDLVGMDVYPQGFAAICGAYSMNGTNMITDIGNGTVSVMQIIDGIPRENTIHTERTGVGRCINAVKQELSRLYGDDVSEDNFERYLIDGVSGKTDEISNVVRQIARDYCEELIKKIYSLGFKENLMRLYVIGGGGRILKNFSEFWRIPGVIFIDDICANAKGYAYLSHQKSERF